MFLNRPRNSFGVGYFYYEYSDDLIDTAAPLVDINYEQGLEAHYSYAVTPWLVATIDLQYIATVYDNSENAFVAGFRSNIRFLAAAVKCKKFNLS